MVIQNDHNVGGADDGLADNADKSPSPELTLGPVHDLRCLLLPFQCADRIPIRTGGIASKRVRPAEKQRGRLVDPSDALETGCGGIKSASPPVRQPSA
jgi:hypothetical protein